MNIYKFSVQQKTHKSENNENKRKATDTLGPLDIQIVCNVFLILWADNTLHEYYLPDWIHTHTKIPWNRHYYSAHMKNAEGKAKRS